MCGFIVVIDNKKEINRAKFNFLNSLISHRGPDSGNVYFNNNIGIGSRRLRIHDLSKESDQPFSSNCGGYKIVFNGAIYNYIELREELIKLGVSFKTLSDTEVIINGHIKFGNDFIKKLDGMFSYLIYDIKKQSIFVGRDHIGIKPLYYYFDKNTLILSSEIKPILAYDGVQKELNENVIQEFFSFQVVDPPNTFFKNIFVFPPSHYLEHNCNLEHNLKFKEYWKIYKNFKNNSELDLESIIENNIRNCWNNDRKTGIQLSGGVDSSLISAISQEKLDIKNIETFSVIFNDDERKYYKPRSEEEYIDYVSKKYSLSNRKFLFKPNDIKESFFEAIWYHEAPLNGPSTVLYYLLAKEIKKYVDVVITGEAVDDIFNGYFNNWQFSDKIDDLFKYFVSPRLLKKYIFGFDENHSKEKINNLLSSEETENMSALEKTSFLLIKRGLHGLLARHDRMFMSNGIEGRPPFAAKNIINSRFSLNDENIYHSGIGKYIIKNITEKYYSRKFVRREKIGFSSPYGDWISDNRYLAKYWNLLNFEFLSNYFNIDAIKTNLSEPNSEQKWSGDNANFLMCLLNFQTFHSVFFENQKYLDLTSTREFTQKEIRKKQSFI